jgi:hypothetical protein
VWVELKDVPESSSDVPKVKIYGWDQGGQIACGKSQATSDGLVKAMTVNVR